MVENPAQWKRACRKINSKEKGSVVDTGPEELLLYLLVQTSSQITYHPCTGGIKQTSTKVLFWLISDITLFPFLSLFTAVLNTSRNVLFTRLDLTHS